MENISFFEMDKQTYADINVWYGERMGEVLQCFEKPKTKGGRLLFEEIIKNPVSDFELLENRKQSNQFISRHLHLDFDKDKIDLIEHYLGIRGRLLRSGRLNGVTRSIKESFKPSNEYHLIGVGIRYICEFISELKKQISDWKQLILPTEIKELIDQFQEIVVASRFKEIWEIYDSGKAFKTKLSVLDEFFRNEKRESIHTILHIIYVFDVYNAIGLSQQKLNWTFSSYTKEGLKIEASDIFHPLIKDPVKNSFAIGDDANLCFLTGANMSGKSTFLKSLGICVFLSHVGFPVPASSFCTSILNGFISTINLSDDINQSYSHFYAEVKRVKEAAKLVKEKRQVLVIFDELFRGTNVKDAHDASGMIISAFADVKDSLFLVSTHIVEVAEELKTKVIDYRCFHAKLEGEKPIYNYLLKNGISNERYGFQIVKNERILELLDA